MQAVASLAPGHAFRLLPTFEPVPLNAVLGRKGFAHHATCRGAEDWENLFFPDPALATAPQPPRAAPDRHAAAGWPAPKQSLDNRDLQPPEPMVASSRRWKRGRPARCGKPGTIASRCCSTRNSKPAARPSR